MKIETKTTVDHYRTFLVMTAFFTGYITQYFSVMDMPEYAALTLFVGIILVSVKIETGVLPDHD